jgi:phosphoglucosamine mutase
MVASGAALGGEQSGHILAASHGLCGDGVLTALQLSTLCHAQGITLSDWLDRSFQPFPQKLVNVTVQSQTRRKQWSSCEPLMAAIRSAEETMGADGRVLVRASGTEPLVRVMVEAADMSLVENWANHLASVVDQSLNAD